MFSFELVLLELPFEFELIFHIYDLVLFDWSFHLI